jgi:hypothetical protein
VTAANPVKPRKRAGRLLLKCPQAPALSLEGGYYAIKERVAFRVGQWRAEVAHHLGSALSCERRAIGVPPGAKQQPIGAQFDDDGNLKEG